jgi:ATP-dependent Lhr-like helicase
MSSSLVTPHAALACFHPIVQQWFAGAFEAPTTAQVNAWPAIASGEHTLLLAPTGSGKTLAAFLVAIDRLMFRTAQQTAEVGTRVLYISPLKALGVDIERNLRGPLAGVRAVAELNGAAITLPTVAIRSGDTPQNERRHIERHPPDILITTPESLYLLLTSKAREMLATVDTVIVDEIHSLAANKRGAHLFVSLERLEELREQAGRDNPLQRIGLSATQRPLDEIARLLGGGECDESPERRIVPRHVRIVEAGKRKQLELKIEVPVEDMARLGRSSVEPPRAVKNSAVKKSAANDDAQVAAAVDDEPDLLAEDDDEIDFLEEDTAAAHRAKRASVHDFPSGDTSINPIAPSIWPAIHPRLVELVRAHRSTMIFVNSRRLAERLAAAINDLAEEEIALAHHGSIAKETRLRIEDRLKTGSLPAIVATSSLELGIDMGAVDLVIQIEAPPSIASGLQRIGRAGHQVGAPSSGVIIPKYRGDLLACAAAAGRMTRGEVEETFYPRNPLDVLAQQIVAMVATGPVDVEILYQVMRRAAPFHELPRSAFEGVLDLLAGRYPSDEFAELRPRVTWDRLAGTVSPRKGTQKTAVLNAGTIPDRGLYGVFLAGDEGPTSRVGELDEEMVFETHTGDVFLLGASSWRVVDITQDRVMVIPAPGEPGKMPFWRGDGPGRPLEFGKAIGELSRTLVRQSASDARARLIADHSLDEGAARNLVEYLQDQQQATEEVPSDQTIVVECFVDEVGDWRVVVLSPYGARVHAPWATAVAARLREDAPGDVDMMWSDDGIVFRLPESDVPPKVELLFPSPDEVEAIVVRELGTTALFAARFRENAARALLLPRHRPGKRTPLWMQRRKSADLLAVASRYPNFPMLLETYRECLRDVFDLPGLKQLLRDVEGQKVAVRMVQTTNASPFAASVMFNYTANFIYDGDAPLAERRAATLALDHAQLRELLGDAELRELLDGDVVDQLAVELQYLDARFVARHPDAVHEMLLKLGDLRDDELALRCDADAVASGALEAWLADLQRTRRILRLRIAGEERWTAAEDVGRFRDAIGVMPPSGLPAAFLETVADPLGDLVSRFARTHIPFRAEDIAARLGTGVAPIRATLLRLAARGRVMEGEFLPGGRGREWCDAEVLRTLKRRSLAKLRREVEPVDPQALARFLPKWQGLLRPRRGLDGLLDVVEQLQGVPLPASALERDILPRRIVNFRPSDLDELCSVGEVLWRGWESIGPGDGRIALYLADNVPLLAPPPIRVEGELAERIRRLLAERGAIFFEDIVRILGDFRGDILSALWAMVWAGEATNDTLAPLRSLRRAQQPRERRRGVRKFRSRRRSVTPGSEGRWSLLETVASSSSSGATSSSTSTERLTFLVKQLIARYGVLTRELVASEGVAGGFSALYPVLKAMEEAGRLRRGYFVAGLGAAQFAAIGAEDQLRERIAAKPRNVDDASDKHDPPEALVLAATDPANAYGTAIEWPATGDGDSRPQRAAGARVVLLDGALIGYLNRTGQSLTTFIPNEEPQHTTSLQALGNALARVAANDEPLLITKIDGKTPFANPAAEPLLSAGFLATSKGLLHRRRREE